MEERGNRFVVGLARGRPDSSGSFTLARRKALEKLSQYQLAQPHLYVLNLVAAAVMSQATRIDIHLSAKFLVFEFDGTLFSGQQLAELPNQILNPTEPRLQELGVALNAAKCLGPEVLTVRSGESAWDELKEELGVLEIEFSKTVVRFRSSLAPRLRRTLVSELPERAALNRARHTRIPIYLNGQLLSRTLKPPSRLPAAYLQPQAPALGVEVPAGAVVGSQVEALLWVGEGPSLELVCRGVTFPVSTQGLVYPFTSAVATSPDLVKNVSHSGVVENSAYRDLVTSINEGFDELLWRRLTSPDPVPVDLRERLVQCATLLISRVADPEPIRSWVREMRLLEDLKSDSHWQSLLEGTLDPIAVERVKKALASALTAEALSGRVAAAYLMATRLQELSQLGSYEWEATARHGRAVLRALMGRQGGGALEDLPEWTRAHLLRWRGEFSEAREFYRGKWFWLGETALAAGEFEQAERYLRRACEVDLTPAAAEALSDCLAFGPANNRVEAFAWRERALGMRDFDSSAFYDDLLQVGGGRISWPAWVRARARKSVQLTSSSRFRTVEQDQNAACELFPHRAGVAIARVKQSVLWAEQKFGAGHPQLAAARSRAAHLLRRAGYWAEADEPVVRGHLLAVVASLTFADGVVLGTGLVDSPHPDDHQDEDQHQEGLVAHRLAQPEVGEQPQ